MKMKGNTYSIDLLGKLSYQPFEKASIFAKAGAAYVNTDFHLSNGARFHEHSYRPVVAGGIDILVNPYVTFEATYSHIFWQGDIHDARHTPALDVF
nr:hypothetical protein [Legionella busanensis]